MSRRTGMITGAFVAVALVGALVLVLRPHYQVKIVMPSAAQLTTGSPVMVDGFQVGEVDELDVVDGRAVVTVSLSGDDVPLHAGTTTSVDWAAALGERLLTVHPGPSNNAVIPSGGLLDAPSAEAEVDQVLAALDEPTRRKLTSLLHQLNATVHDVEPELRQSLRSTGPAVAALGAVAAAVGKDGPAIQELVSQLRQMTATVVARQDKVQGVVTDMAGFTSAAAANQQQLSDGLRELPSTLSAARETLGRVGPAADATVPLLDDLRPAMDRLPAVAGDLSPLMRDVRPAIAELRPTLAGLDRLLGQTPALLDVAHDTIPPLGRAADGYGPAARFLRPYTPEFVAFLGNWGSSFSSFDSQGHVWAGLLTPGTNVFNDSPVRPPGAVLRAEPKPGAVVGQPWEDATGDGIR